jgi:uncharacterized DUF497 family protein
VRIDWDDGKSEKLKRERGISLEEAADVFASGYATDQKADDPEQYYAIGFAKGQLVTVIYEYREDAEGELIWLVTCWKATKREAKIYEQERK